MANTLYREQPRFIRSDYNTNPTAILLNKAAATAFTEGQIVDLTAGLATVATAASTAVAGIALESTPTGAKTTVLVQPFRKGDQYIMNCDAGVSAQAMLGASYNLEVVSTIFCVDKDAQNLAIVKVIDFPKWIVTKNDGTKDFQDYDALGDTGGRVIVKFLATALD